jgi:hypothetical protein
LIDPRLAFRFPGFAGGSKSKADRRMLPTPPSSRPLREAAAFFWERGFRGIRSPVPEGQKYFRIEMFPPAGGRIWIPGVGKVWVDLSRRVKLYLNNSFHPDFPSISRFWHPVSQNETVGPGKTRRRHRIHPAMIGGG